MTTTPTSHPAPNFFLHTRRGRLTLFFLLYLAEGLPLGLSIFALTAYFRLNAVPVAEIGVFTAAIIAPWSLKWLWAPLLDLIRPQRFGPNRSWIVFTQLMMAATLAFLFALDPAQDLGLLTTLMVVHNVFAATQDVAIDGFAARILPESDLNWANGLMFAAQNIGMAIGGGGALFVASLYGFPSAFALVLAALLAILLSVSLRIREDPEAAPTANPATAWPAALAARLGGFFRDLWIGFARSGPGPRIGVFFSILPSGAMALAFGIASALLVDADLTEQQISAATTIGLLAAGAGCVLAGPLGDRFGGKSVAATATVIGSLATAALGFQIWQSGLDSLTFGAYIAYAIVYRIGYGMLYGSLGAIVMAMTNPAVAATQFTGYMSLRNVAIAYSSAWHGYAVGLWNYGPTLLLDALAGLLLLSLLPFLTPSTTRAQAAPAATPSAASVPSNP